MNTDIQIFKNDRFGEVRVTEIEGKTYFVGSDVAKALGYSNPHDAIIKHCKSDGLAIREVIDSMGRKQQAKYIDEGNLYRLAAKSELPGAEEFESWIFDDVLTSIRKHGGYIAAHQDDTPEVIMARALFVAKETMDRLEDEKQRLILTNTEQTKQLKEAAPKVEYYDNVLCSKSRITVNSIAQCLGISHIKLNKLLCEWGIQYSQSGVYFLSSKYRNMGLAKHEPYTYTDSNGEQQTKQHLYWTETGKKFIIELYYKKIGKAA